MTDLWDALQLGFMQRAYLAGLVAGVVCPAIGTFLVLRRLALIADGLGHVSFAGVAAGLMLRVHPLASAVVVALVGALGVERLRATRRTAGDVAIAIYSALGLGAGIVVAKLAGGVNVDLFGFLFGSLVAVRPSDLAWIAGIGLVVLAAVAAFYKELVSITVDEETARASGVPVDAINQVLIVLAALTIVLAMRVVGILLVTSLMVLPVAASLQFARGIGRTLACAIGLGAASVLVGLTVAYLANLPAGGAIVLTSVALFAGSVGIASAATARTPGAAAGD